MLPKITVVTVVYNGILTLDATIKSVISQTYSNFPNVFITIEQPKLIRNIRV